MDLTSKFLAFTLLGTEWVLWVLVVLSVVSVAVMLERFLFHARRGIDLNKLTVDVRAALRGGDVTAAIDRYKDSEAIAAVVATTGLREAKRGAGAAAEAMVSARAFHRPQLERRVAILGTLGNNAPFIGLFGTVLGIIRAFDDLAQSTASGAAMVMTGISQALVATAVGLMVAIPAVLSFNYFNRRTRSAIAQADTIAHVILTELRAEKPAAKDDARLPKEGA